MNNSLLLGNGLFRLKTNMEKKIGGPGRDKSWGDLLSELAFDLHTSYYAAVPLPQEFDRLVDVLTRNRDELLSYYSIEGRHDGLRKVLVEDADNSLIGVKRYIASWFNERSATYPDVLERLFGIPFDSVQTTNYDKRIENFLERKGNELTVWSEENNDTTFATGACGKFDIYHCHGIIEIPGSMIIGQEDYIANVQRINNLFEKLNGEKDGLSKRCWPFRFLDSNIFILGFGFGFDEIDFWRVLHLRSLYFSQHRKAELNHIHYFNLYPSGGETLELSDSPRALLFHDYGVEIQNVPIIQGDYEDAYMRAIDLIDDFVRTE